VGVAGGGGRLGAVSGFLGLGFTGREKMGL